MTIKIALAYDYILMEKLSDVQTKVLETVCKFVVDIPHQGKINVIVEDGPSTMSKDVE